MPLITSRPPCAVAPAYWLASPSTMTMPDINVFRHAGADRAFDPNSRLLVHTGAVIAGGAFDGHFDGRIQAYGNRVRPFGVVHLPGSLVGFDILGLQGLIQAAQAIGCYVICLHISGSRSKRLRVRVPRRGLRRCPAGSPAHGIPSRRPHTGQSPPSRQAYRRSGHAPRQSRPWCRRQS